MLSVFQATVDIRGNLGGGVAGQTDLGVIVAGFLGAAIVIAALLSFGYLVLGGLAWVMSGGDKGKVESAQKKITQAIVGLALVAASYALFQIVQYFFGIQILE